MSQTDCLLRTVSTAGLYSSADSLVERKMFCFHSFFFAKKIGHQRRQFSPPVSDETPVFHGAEGEIGYGHVVLFGQDVFHAKVRFEKVGDPRRHLQGEAVQ